MKHPKYSDVRKLPKCQKCGKAILEDDKLVVTGKGPDHLECYEEIEGIE